MLEGTSHRPLVGFTLHHSAKITTDSVQALLITLTAAGPESSAQSSPDLALPGTIDRQLNQRFELIAALAGGIGKSGGNLNFLPLLYPLVRTGIQVIKQLPL